MRFLAVVALYAVVATGIAACQTSQEQAVAQPDMLLDDEPLLLLDDSAEDDSRLEGGADNSRCYVCHVNYQQEDLAVTHTAVGIGCARCHGESDEHMADESWAEGGNGTAPEAIYTLDQVNPFCMECHPGNNLYEEPHEAVLSGAATEKYCTDCHGEHRLHIRRLKWK